MRRLDQTGRKFGRLTAVSVVSWERPARWLCRCECGSETIVRSAQLSSGKTKSCGCLRNEKTAQRNFKHGYAVRGQKPPEYNVWHHMIQRCNNHNNNRYEDWGGRGIKICDKWVDDFEAFYADMGKRPSANHSIDRINNDGDYEPGNCRWATPKEQSSNRRKRGIDA